MLVCAIVCAGGGATVSEIDGGATVCAIDGGAPPDQLPGERAYEPRSPRPHPGPTMAKTRFRVLDAMPAPHGGHILRLRLQEGDPPPLRTLRNARLRASGPDGHTAEAEVEGFALFGGRPSDDRLLRSGRVDVRIRGEDAGVIGLQWDVELD